MAAPIDKNTYINIVKFTLESMLNLSKKDKTYSLQADIINYYNKTIRPEMILTQDEFIKLCKEIGIKQDA